MNKKNLVVFLGLKTTGKDYNSQAYISAGSKKIAFADTLRDMLYKILGFYPDENFTYDDFKKCELTTKKNKLFSKKITVTTGRKLLQNIGSVIKDVFGETFWADLWANRVLESDSDVVCTDCRFDYEIKKAMSLKKKGYNVSFIWVCYEKANFKEILKDKHESEKLSQFIYYNQKKYDLYDLCKINDVTIKQILKDFENENKQL